LAYTVTLLLVVPVMTPFFLFILVITGFFGACDLYNLQFTIPNDVPPLTALLSFTYILSFFTPATLTEILNGIFDGVIRYFFNNFPSP
jgi:predicted neutral ceramidase superfamily lipid hydrolase